MVGARGRVLSNEERIRPVVVGNALASLVRLETHHGDMSALDARHGFVDVALQKPTLVKRFANRVPLGQLVVQQQVIALDNYDSKRATDDKATGLRVPSSMVKPWKFH